MTSTIRKIYKNHHHTVTLRETISFHLSSDDEDNETLRITTSIERAKKLVDTIFPENQKLQLIMILPDNFKKNILKKLLRRYTFTIIDSFCTDSWQEYYDKPVTVLVVETSINNLRLTKLIEGICYQDFPKYGKLTVEIPIIFYNNQTDTLLTIYDDRFADIWSSDLKIQQELKQNVSSWILN
ncbi:hypothetical protein [uncultured Enterococcus sp.]|uniref:DUF3885 domain-containing protein n=1 Tax=uncultured Enterococcus sp. TaxID=167972 RepID=UPI0025F53BCC|nr:hypothetical protein [uncultured Enterococcus sp.]